MINSPPEVPAAESPNGARGCEAELCVKLQASDGRGICRISEAEAAEIVISGLGYRRRSREVWLKDQASPASRTPRTWSGNSNRPSTLRHNNQVREGFRLPRAPRLGFCRRFAIAGKCSVCGDMVTEIHIDRTLKISCGTCCSSCAEQRRIVGDL